MKRIFTAFLCLFAMVGMAQNIVFQETFDKCDGKGGNTSTDPNTKMFFSGITGNASPKYDNSGWKIPNNDKAYAAGKCVKLGTSSKKGGLTTPNISLTGSGTLTFRAAGWEGGKNGEQEEKKDITVSLTGATFQDGSTSKDITLKKAAWNIYTLNLDNANNPKITFVSKKATRNRFFLDDVVVKDAATTTQAIIIGEAGYTTLFTDKVYQMPMGLTGNTVTTSGTTITLHPSFPSGSSVPANTPLLIAGSKGNYSATTITETVSPFSGNNQLKGTLTTETISVGSGNVYVFAKNLIDDVLGFYWQNGTDGTTLTNAAGKCYLEVSGGSGVQGFRLDGTLTAIEAAATEKGDEQIYDLSGRRVSNAGRGLYIVNGKKVIR